MSHLLPLTGALLVAGMFSSSLFGQQTVAYTEESLGQIKQKVEGREALLLDVRELSEWQEGHLKHAVSIPTSVLTNPRERGKMLNKLDRSKVVYCHCKAGGRALVCGQLLKDMGYDVRPLKYSYQSIVAAGFTEIK